MEKRRINAGIRIGLSLLLFYTLAFALLTWPLCRDPWGSYISHATIHDRGDAPVFVWNIYNFTESIRAGENPFFTDRLLYPAGASLIMHTYGLVYCIVGLVVGNYTSALNIVLFASFILSAVGAYLLCKRYVNDNRLAALAGFAFAFCPYKMAHLWGHYNLMLTAAIPFFVWLFVGAFKYPANASFPTISRPHNLALAAICLAITAISDYYYTFYLLCFTMLYLAYFAAIRYNIGAHIQKRWLYWIVGTIFIPSAAAWFLRYRLHLNMKGAFSSAADILSFLIPDPRNRVFGGPFLQEIYTRLLGDSMEKVLYAGFGVLIFAICYFVSKQYRQAPRDLKALIFTMLGFFVLSMPIVCLGRKHLFCFPNALLHFVPFINNIRVSARYDIMIMLFLPIISLLFFEKRILARAARMWHYPLIGMLFACMLIEYMPNPYTVAKPSDIPRVYHVIAGRPDGTLLEIPFGIHCGTGAIGDSRPVQLWYQTVHHKKMIAGYISRIPKNTFLWFMAEPVVSDLLAMQEDDSVIPKLYDTGTRTAFIRKFDLKYILVYPECQGTPIEAYILRSMGEYAISDEKIDGFRLITVRVKE